MTPGVTRFDDVIQDTIVAVSNALPLFTEDTSLGRWVFSIYRNKANDNFRQSGFPESSRWKMRIRSRAMTRTSRT